MKHQIEFNFDGVNTNIQCKENEKLKDIFKSLKFKVKAENKILIYMYNGITIQNEESTFNEIANLDDKKRGKMNILVVEGEIPEVPHQDIFIKSNNIICPECEEDIKFRIEDYKINLFECKNNHRINNILFNNFEKTKMINLTSIKCGICKEKNKHNTYNNKFYKCYECNMDICPLCKLKHNKEHNIINYDKIHFICNKHGEILINYCTKCRVNICSMCEKEHFKHNKQSIIDMVFDKDELLNNLN